MLSILRGFEERDQRVDLFISNYVYEKVYEGTHTAIGYKFALPRKKIFTWDQIGHFRLDQNLLMHSLCYRTDVLRESNLPMPPHTFYVDNIYAYVPLPRCKTMYYADIDLYRYFIGREGRVSTRHDGQASRSAVPCDAHHDGVVPPVQRCRVVASAFVHDGLFHYDDGDLLGAHQAFRGRLRRRAPKDAVE